MTYIVTSSTASAPPYFEIYHDRTNTDHDTGGIPLNNTSYNTAGFAGGLTENPTFSAHPLNSVAGDSVIVNNTIDSSRLAKSTTGFSGVTIDSYHPDDQWWIAPSSSHKYYLECEILVILPSTSDKIEWAGIGVCRSNNDSFSSMGFNDGKVMLDQTKITTAVSINNPTWPAGNYQLIKYRCPISAHSSYAVTPSIDWLSATDHGSMSDYMVLDGCGLWNLHAASHPSYAARRLKVIRRWAKLTQLA